MERITSPSKPSTPTGSPSRSFLLPRRRSLTQTTSKSQVDEAKDYRNYSTEKEAIKAYLRIRPTPPGYEEEPYIKVIDNIEVLMTPPKNSNAYRTRQRVSEKYRFTRIFQEGIDQQTFFKDTTLDLVKDVLNGNNALIFAYGVTNSGKTFTVMGKDGNAGLLPRALNVIFNSIQNLKSEAKIKPMMHSLAQTYENDSEENRDILNSCNIEDVNDIKDDFIIDIDTHYEYGIWVSFIEVYNEQVFDLLDTNKTCIKRNQLHLKYEQRSGNKYVADMNLIRVHTMVEAHAIMKLGQQNRQVFSTLMNQTSSRSHSIFTIHVVKCPIMEEFIIEDPNCVTVSKLSIIDLAGSERYKNTNSTGQRLKEAGNINKSLMVLGQCMEVLRMNQIRAEMGKSTAIVPFRHSKLTELFKSTFEGNGKAVIIVNVNPFDTGYDENSHVMKFAAVAKDVTTLKQIQPKLDLRQIETSSKRLRISDETDHLVDELISQLNEIRNKWMDAEARANHAEINTHKEFKKMEEMYLLALKRESDMMEIQISNTLNDTIDERENELLNTLHQRQEILAKDVNYLKSQMQDTLKKQSINDKISDSQWKRTSPEDEEDDEMQKENEAESFNSFLSLRKQLRKSIFKREELCKDADNIMNQVEQFDGVTFELAKDTKMGKLLKLIAQEEFEKDPYQIRNRAIRLFKRYAQLPTKHVSPIAIDDNQHEPPRKEFSNMVFEQDLRAENAWLKHRVEYLNKGQNRLKVAIEKILNQDDISDVFDHRQVQSLDPISIPIEEEEDGSSDLEKVLSMRHKKRRKLRSR